MKNVVRFTNTPECIEFLKSRCLDICRQVEKGKPIWIPFDKDCFFGLTNDNAPKGVTIYTKDCSK